MARIIISILLIFISFQSHSQIAMWHSHNFTQPQLLLDIYPGAQNAYSVRKLRTNYSGACMRVRRSSDNTEQDIGFTANGDLDTSALKTFVGSSNGFVTVFYDQTTTAVNMVNTITSEQPRIVNAGVIDRKSGKPCIYFNRAASNYLSTNYSSGITASIRATIQSAGVSFFQVSHNLGNAVDDLIMTSLNENFDLGRQSSPSWGIQIRPTLAAVTTTVPGTTSYISSFPSFNSNTSYVLTGSWGGNSSVVQFRRNGVDATDSGVSGSTLRNGSSNMIYFTGYIFESIIYISNKHSDRVNIEANINTYYSIY